LEIPYFGNEDGVMNNNGKTWRRDWAEEKAARRSGMDIGRYQTAQLMRSLGIEGVSRSRRVKTAKPDPTTVRHPDLVKCDFTATAPNPLWVTELMFVPTWAGLAGVCFIIDAYSRMTIGGWVA
jgi:putative transposase